MQLKKISGVLIVLLLLACTNPFDTRKPEEPTSEDNLPSSTLQSNPDSLLTKIQLAFKLKDTKSYGDCFADSLQLGTGFTFIPESDESPRLINWSRNDEINYFNKFVNAEDLQEVNIEYSDRIPFVTFNNSPDTLQGQFNYRITAEFKSKTESYQGRSIVNILKSQPSLWYVFKWEDFKIDSDTADSTWSTLKANYR